MSNIITGVQFGITSPDEILRRSVVEVVTDKTYQGNNPVPGGVFDSRLGVIDSGKICPTCKHTNMKCQGHFGHITLARPVYLYQFLEYLEKILYCVCINCSNLYINPSEEEKSVHVLLISKRKLVNLRKVLRFLAVFVVRLSSKR